MTIVRCFVLSFVLIKAFDCLVPSEAAQPTIAEVPSNSPIHPTIFANRSFDETQPSDSFDDSRFFGQNMISSLWFIMILAPLIHCAYQSYSTSSRTPTVCKPNDELNILRSSNGAMTLSLIFGVALARIPIDQNAVVSLCNGFSLWYMNNLEENPLLTKCLTSSLFTWLGDLIAQVFEEMIDSDKSFFQNYDRRRGFAFILDGIVLSGPLMHYAFDLMETMFPTEGEDGSILSSIIHVFLTDYLLDTTYIFLSFVLLALIEGEIHDLRMILKKNWWSTVKAGWCTNVSLVPIEFVCFHYLSVGYRVLGMNMVDVLWQSVVSFFAHRGRKKAHHKAVHQQESTLTACPHSATNELKSG